jgi:hypothetical protein
MSLVVRAFPILAGQEMAMEQFANEASARAAELAEFYCKFGVRRESWHVQATTHGTWVIGVTEVSDRPLAEAAAEYAASRETFDRWFKDRVYELTGINPDLQPLGPPTHCILDWSAPHE